MNSIRYVALFKTRRLDFKFMNQKEALNKEGSIFTGKKLSCLLIRKNPPHDKQFKYYQDK